MEPVVATINIALPIMVIGVFAVSWLHQRAINRCIDDLRTYLDVRFAALDQAKKAHSSNIRKNPGQIPRV
jgi:hypothetical protein